MRIALTALLIAAAIPAVALAAKPSPAPVTKARVAPFGTVLFTTQRQALYRWSVEQKAGNKIRCVGSCAREQWPPLIVPKGRTVAAHKAGYRGTFGTIRRPDGRRQLTYRGVPLYSYAHEGPGQVLCNDVDGWFVVRA